ncbi:hypothetical protein CTA2_6779 [Colletotrichum tanaceti]|uniref:Uncharacterized protein n=1 Tax=Colletotrichum tanaceti TaxID=1306861 RepID=A0A4U6XC71_9PEZI|nr:hypothetical protein CTA2_6779 [Colletotrichum tanaceti]TKW52759.1 hypothetical protein CTA1_7512 [Colletotrichum tanaceti]
MSTGALDCPEGDSNSTDCLLRAVLRVLKENQDQEDGKYDWDPVTFVFTVLLGVGALAFAGLTITQGLVAARKGYRKASRRAISTWAENTQREWIWGELNFQYTARTPIFRIDYLLDWVDDRNPRGGLGSAYVEIDAGHALQSATAATWITFFKVTGLEKVRPPGTTRPSKKVKATVKARLLDRIGLKEKAEPSEDLCGLRSVVADFLPDDLVAAPAYAQGGVVIAAAAAVGIQRWPFTKGFPEQPVIIGHSFQFDFRQHPILGSIGSFSSHHPTERRIMVPNPHTLKSTMRHSLGIVRLHGMPDSGDQTFDVDLIRFYESFKEPMVEVARFTDSVHPTTPYYDQFEVPRAFLRELVNASHCLFKAVTPNDPPELFPLASSKLSMNCSLTLLALCGHYWAEADLDTFGKSKLGRWPSPRFDYGNVPWSRFKWLHYTELCVDKDGIRGDEDVLQLCLQQLDSPDKVRDWYSKAEPATQQDIRRRILDELRRVDKWLGCKEDVEFRTANLYKTYLLLSHVEKVVEAGAFNDLAVKAGWEDSRATDYYSEFASRSRHLRMMQVLRNLLDALGLTQDTLEAVIGPVGDLKPSEHLAHVGRGFDVYWEELNAIAGPSSSLDKQSTHLLLDRLGMIVVYNSEPEADWPLWKRFSERRDDPTREVDDVLIFRFILMVLLFQTTIDNSEVLNSSLWDRVIPII